MSPNYISNNDHFKVERQLAVYPAPNSLLSYHTKILCSICLFGVSYQQLKCTHMDFDSQNVE